MWFETLTGFREESPEQVRKNLKVLGNQLFSLVNGKRYTIGTLEIPSLEELRNKVDQLSVRKGKIKVSETIGDVQKLHLDPENEFAVFQAASQFNLLEMMGPHVSPERGVGIYELDFTQGPACAVACGAGTIYRNYFVPVANQLGQTNGVQIDCLSDIGILLGNPELQLWEMTNGYAMLNQKGILYVNSVLSKQTVSESKRLKDALRVGIQWNTQVTLDNSHHKVSQVYCSALPVAYSHLESAYWQRFAMLILEATYEATVLCAIINYSKTNCNKLFLTLVGGGAFGNEMDWILGAIDKVLTKYSEWNLDITFVSYGQRNAQLLPFIEGY